MANFNAVTIVGRIGQDIELRHLPSGVPVATMSVCVNETWKDKDGNKQERPTWVQVEAFQKLAELCNQYLRKGSSVLVAGKLREDRWESQDGQKRSKLKVVAEVVQFLDSKGQDTTEADAPANAARMARASRPAPATGGAGQHEPIGESDIPFAPDAHSSIWS